MLDFDFNNDEKVLTCIFKGRLDTILCSQLSPELESKFGSLNQTQGPNDILDFSLVFDLREVDFISSSFIRLCVGSSKRVRSGSFSITNTNPFLKKTFKIAGLDEILDVK